MVDLIRGGAYIASAVILYHGITKEKVLSEVNVRNATLGALFGLFVGPKLEDMVRNYSGIPEETKTKIFGALAGAGVGAGVAHLYTRGAVDALKDKIDHYVNNGQDSSKQAVPPATP